MITCPKCEPRALQSGPGATGGCYCTFLTRILKRTIRTMSDKNDPGARDDWFRREMQDVKPLKQEPRAPGWRAPVPPAPRQRDADEALVMEELLLPADPGDAPETGEELQFLRPGYQHSYLKRLRRGRYAIRDHLDLHHMTETVARDALLRFIGESVASGYGCVRVVHGKGLRSRTRPKLKLMTDRLLRRHKAVVAFASCRPADGGTGAVTVLLRRPRP